MAKNRMFPILNGGPIAQKIDAEDLQLMRGYHRRLRDAQREAQEHELALHRYMDKLQDKYTLNLNDQVSLDGVIIRTSRG